MAAKIKREPLMDHRHLGPMQDALSKVGIICHLETRTQRIQGERGNIQEHVSHHLVIPIGVDQVRESLKILLEQNRLLALAKNAKLEPPRNGMTEREAGKYVKTVAEIQVNRIENFSRVKGPIETRHQTASPRPAPTGFLSKLMMWIRQEQEKNQSELEEPRQETPSINQSEQTDGPKTTGGRLTTKLQAWLRPQQDLDPSLKEYSATAEEPTNVSVEEQDVETGQLIARRRPHPQTVMISNRPMPADNEAYQT